MTHSLPYRAIFTATGTLLVGWLLGYLMAGPTVHESGAQGEASASSETGLATRERQWRVQSLSGTSDVTGGSYGDSLIDPTRPSMEQFETLMRGALRLTDNTDRMVRLRDIARSIALADLPAAVERAKRLPRSESWLVMQALGARWAEAAPTAAAEFALKEGGNRHGWNQLLNGVIEKWASVDNQGAVTWIKTQPEGRQLSMMQSLIQSVARQDPEGALRILQSQPDSYQLGWMHDEVFAQWSKRDPAGAAKAAEAMTKGGSRERALQSVASSWAAQDPAAAVKWAESFPDKSKQNQLLRSVANTWAEQEPLAVIKWAGTLTEPMMRQGVLTAALNQLAQSDLTSAKTHLLGFPPGQERDNIVTQVAYAASQQDAKGGLALLELLPEGPGRTSATANMATRIATTDPKGAAEIFANLPAGQLSYQTGQFAAALAGGNMEFAREWTDQLTDPQMKSQAMRAVAGVLARGDPKAAAEWLIEKQPSADLTWLLNNWVRNAPKDVLAWCKALPEGDAKRSAQSSVVQNMAFVDVEQARKIFMEDLSPEARTTSAGQLASQWASRDVTAARKWAEALPPGGARDNALGGIARTWATQNAAAATQWLEGFGAGDERDRVVTQFAGAVVQRDPASALSWATTIGDPDLRGAQVEQLAGRWLQSDAGAARDWINTTDQLTPSARRRILEQRSPSYQYYNNFNYDYD